MSNKHRKQNKLADKIDRAILNGWSPGRGRVGDFARKTKQKVIPPYQF